MANNDILPFATGSGAYVTDQSTYAGLSSVSVGFQPGVAPTSDINKVFRQSSLIATMLAQFIADNQPNDVQDNGDQAALEAQLIAALGAVIAPPIVMLTSPGVTSVTVPNWATKIQIELIGGGGGAGGVASGASHGSAGGGAGAYLWGVTAVTPGHNLQFTVGAGGLGGANGNAGSAGGDTKLIDQTTGTNLGLAGGGGAGSGSSGTLAGGAGGTPNEFNLAGLVGYPGQYGQDGASSTTGYNVTGSGGEGPYGGAGRSSTVHLDQVVNGQGPGCGGSGLYTTTSAGQGGNGAPGYISFRFLP